VKCPSFCEGTSLPWIYRFVANDRFPDPVPEIRYLFDLFERGQLPYLLLAGGHAPPLGGNNANLQVGDRIFLTTSVLNPSGRSLAVHGFAQLGSLHIGATPPSVAGLYGPLEDRRFRELTDLHLYQDGPIDAKSIRMCDDEVVRFLSGRAFVKEIDPVAWRMNILRLTNIATRASDWYHLSIAGQRGIMRQLPAAPEDELVLIMEGTRRELSLNVTEQFLIDRQFTVADACKRSGQARIPPITEHASWHTVAVALEREYTRGEGPWRLRRWVMIASAVVFSAVSLLAFRFPRSLLYQVAQSHLVEVIFAAIIAPILVAIVLRWFNFKS